MESLGTLDPQKMTPKEVQVLMKACQMAGIDARKISPVNPFTKNGKTAEFLQVAVAEVDPQLAAKWRVESGAGVSVATLAEQQSGMPLSDAAKQDLYLHDPKFVADSTKEQSKGEAELMKFFDDEAAKMRLANRAHQYGGNVEYAKQQLKAEDARAAAEKQARLESEKHAREMQQRIAQRQAQTRLPGTY